MGWNRPTSSSTRTVCDGPAIDVEVENYQQQYVLFNFHQEVINHRWECLHNSSEFFCLTDAIIAHVIIVKQ